MNTIAFEEFENVNKEELTAVLGGSLPFPPIPPYPDPSPIPSPDSDSDSYSIDTSELAYDLGSALGTVPPFGIVAGAVGFVSRYF